MGYELKPETINGGEALRCSTPDGLSPSGASRQLQRRLSLSAGSVFGVGNGGFREGAKG